MFVEVFEYLQARGALVLHQLLSPLLDLGLLDELLPLSLLLLLGFHRLHPQPNLLQFSLLLLLQPLSSKFVFLRLLPLQFLLSFLLFGQVLV